MDLKLITSNLKLIGKTAKEAAHQMANISTLTKNHSLELIAKAIFTHEGDILESNQRDLELAKEEGLSEAFLDRLMLNSERLTQIADDIMQLISLTDPIGEIFNKKQLKNGLKLHQKRVPLGVIGVIYEARPNVTFDVAALCLKTGNSIILKGGRETLHTNLTIVKIINQALKEANLPEGVVQYVDGSDRAIVTELLQLDRYIDLIIPRGGEGLHRMCQQNSTIPLIIGGFGISHIFVDESADLEKSLMVIDNAKLDRPSACNALDTLLVHEKIATEFFYLFAAHFQNKLIIKADLPSKIMLDEIVSLSQTSSSKIKLSVELADESDFYREWLSRTLSVKIVKNIEDAVGHMYKHNASHSDAIMTHSPANAEYFLNTVDSAAVYLNASTRFTDGGQFGLGAEIAVSTQKLHARGPMGLEALTSYKWVGEGNYLLRS